MVQLSGPRAECHELGGRRVVGGDEDVGEAVKERLDRVRARSMEPRVETRADIRRSWQHRQGAVVVWSREADKLSVLEIDEKPNLGKEVRTKHGTRNIGEDELV